MLYIFALSNLATWPSDAPGRIEEGETNLYNADNNYSTEDSRTCFTYAYGI